MARARSARVRLQNLRQAATAIAAVRRATLARRAAASRRRAATKRLQHTAAQRAEVEQLLQVEQLQAQFIRGLQAQLQEQRQEAERHDADSQQILSEAMTELRAQARLIKHQGQ